MVRKFKEVIIGAIILLFAILYFAGSFSIAKYGDASVDSRFIPQILGIFLMILSVFQISSGIRNLNKTNNPQPQVKIKFNKRVVLTLANIIVYISLMEKVGFLIMTIIFLILQSIILTNKESRKYATIFVLSIIFSISVYIIFVKGFSLTLPSGILG